MTRLHSPRALLSLVTAMMMAVALVLVSGFSTTRAQGTSVTIEGFAFNPGSITVAAGTTVTWTNNDSAPHTVTADDGSFDSGNMAQGATYSMTFNTPGTYSYFCAIHPDMVATVVVTGGDDGGTDDGTDDDGADDGTAPEQMPTTGSGTTALGDSTSLLLALGAAASALFVIAIRQRRLA